MTVLAGLPQLSGQSSGLPATSYVAVGVSVIAWATAFPAVAIALTEIQPVPLAAMRVSLAALVMLGWLLWARPKLPSLQHLGRFALCGFFGFALYGVCINVGQSTVAAGAASFIVNIIPILTALMAWIFLGEKVSAIGWLGSLVSFAGLGYIASSQPGGLSFGAGTTFVLAAALCTTTYFVLQKPLLPVYGALGCMAYTLMFAVLFMIPWMPQAVHQVAAASPRAMLAVLSLALLPTLLSYISWNVALARMPAAVAANFIYLVPPTAALMAFLFLGERPTVPMMVGGASAVLGTVMVAKWGKMPAAAT